MAIKLDIKDKKIINELWRDARQADTAIAKKIGLSREVVSYRIKRLEKLGAIKDYITLVDTARLGYITFNVYVRLRDFDTKKEKEIIDIIKKNPHVKWLINISGQYDLFYVMIARNRAEFDDQITELYNNFDEHVSASLILSSIKVMKDLEFFYPQYKLPAKRHYKETVEPAPETEKVALKRVDYEILDIISLDARMNVVDISKELKKRKFSLTPEAITYRLKKLHDMEVIRGYRAVLDYKQLGYLWYKVLLRLRRLPQRLEMQLKEYLKQNKKVLFTDKTLGEWNIRVELLVKDHDELHEELLKLRNILSDFLLNYELILIFQDHMMVSFTKGIYEKRPKED